MVSGGGGTETFTAVQARGEGGNGMSTMRSLEICILRYIGDVRGQHRVEEH